MNLKDFLELIRVKDQLAVIFALVIAVIGYSFTPSPLILPFIIFIVFLASFTFIINDIADEKLDRLNRNTRNLIAKNKIAKPIAITFGILFFLLSSIMLVFLTVQLALLGLSLIFLSLTYHFLIKAKSTPIIDVIYHGLGPAIVFAMINLMYKSFDINSLLSVAIVFLTFSIVELLQEVRDYNTDKKLIKTTAVVLGKKNTILLSIYFTIIMIGLFLSAIIFEIFPFKYVLYLPLFYFLISPLLKTLRNDRLSSNIVDNYRKKLIIAGALFILITLALPYI